ncbi:MAG: PAS domain S-box protein, partial [Candidatus Limnocylindria bacterium]
MATEDPAHPSIRPSTPHGDVSGGVTDAPLLTTRDSTRSSEQRFRALAAASGGVFFQMSADWSELHVLDGRGLVADNDAPIRDWLQRHIPESEHATIRERIAYCMQHQVVFELEHRVYGPDRAVGWACSRAVPVLDDAGQIAEWIGSATDITQRKTAEEQLHRNREELEDRVQQRARELAETNAALRSEREFLSAVLEHAVDGIVACDGDGTLRLFNRASREFHGLPEQRLPPDQWAEHYDLYESDGTTRMRKERVPLFRALIEGAIRDVEMVIAPKHQQPRRLLANGRAILDDEGRTVGAVVVMHDLTAAKLAEAERERAIREEAARLEAEASALQLRTSDERLRLALLIAQMGTFEIDLPTDRVTVNEAGREIYGWPADEPLTFTKVQSHFHPDDREAVMGQVGDAMRPGGPGEFEVEQRIVRTDGTTRWIRVRGRAMFETVDGERHAVLCIGIYLDITDQKDAEGQREQMLASERTARTEAERAGRMKDEFLATLSHELRTPLNAILGWSQILTSSKGVPEEITDGLRTIERNARAQAQIIEDLLDMSRIISGKVRLDVQRVDLATLLRDAVDTIKPSADAKGIRLTAVLDPLA